MDDEVTGIYLPLEKVEPAQFDLPDPSHPGDYRSARLLRDAVRLGFRSSAGPFRSFAKLAFEPRPYQLVPLLMALKLDPVRMLIADDVGIGKTIEAGLVARELLDRGEVERLAVLCPPQLAEQWQAELQDKFNISAELVLPGTTARLERATSLGQSLFDVYPHVIVSLDFIKSDRRRTEFLRTCPELVIVDEAHTCAFGWSGRGGRHQRYELLAGLSQNLARHLILVTATPHSGKEEAFRSLLTLLNPEFEHLPDELTGPQNEHHRRKLANQFVQRRRADIRHYMEADTPFPEREDSEETYKLSDEYKRLFERVLEYAREIVSVPDPSGNRFRPLKGTFGQRVRWWSALALLRSLASSPAAAAATLRARAATADAETPEDADEIGQRTVLDLMDDGTAEGMDVTPGSDIGEAAVDEHSNRRRLMEMARAAEALMGKPDEKLQKAIKLVKGWLAEGFRPILFCRFIPTAEYVADQLRAALPKSVEVAPITGLLPPAEREARIAQLADAKDKKRVLVCTDCLSEGINLQDHFDAVMHYDLSWNPTRHEQREGRVDRYGQLKPTVRALTYYGIDNQIDGVVWDVLLRKHRTIRNSLGISVPVPVDTSQVIEAIFEGLLLRERSSAGAQYLPGFEAHIKPHKEELFNRWEADSEREKRSRTMFAQEAIKVEEVARELRAARMAVGSGVDVAAFTREALLANGAAISLNGTLRAVLDDAPRALREAIGNLERFEARFERPIEEGQLLLTRTHPLVEGLATYVMDTTLDPLGESVAQRCGVIRTRAVERRATALLVRFRYHLLTRREVAGQVQDLPLLAEDCRVLAFAGSPQNAEWLDEEQAEALLQATPDANIAPEQATDFLRKAIEGFEYLRPHVDGAAQQRGVELLDAHQRVREAARLKGIRYRVEPQLPPDVLGIYIYLPALK
jgi:superfamily II DNA or RNA helicase